MTVARAEPQPGLQDLPGRFTRFWRSISGQETPLEALPGGIRLAVLTSPFIVRWASWLIALLIVVLADLPDENTRF